MCDHFILIIKWGLCVFTFRVTACREQRQSADKDEQYLVPWLGFLLGGCATEVCMLSCFRGRGVSMEKKSRSLPFPNSGTAEALCSLQH